MKTFSFEFHARFWSTTYERTVFSGGMSPLIAIKQTDDEITSHDEIPFCIMSNTQNVIVSILLNCEHTRHIIMFVFCWFLFPEQCLQSLFYVNVFRQSFQWNSILSPDFRMLTQSKVEKKLFELRTFGRRILFVDTVLSEWYDSFLISIWVARV